MTYSPGMSIFSAIVVYIMIFWTVLFAILPWGNRAHQNYDDGLAGSAPEKPRIRQKFLIAGAVSTVLWLMICMAIHYGAIDLYEIGREMAEEDYGL